MDKKKVIEKVIEKTSKFLSEMGEIENFNINHNTIYIDLKDKTTAEIKYNDSSVKGVYWSVKDFEYRAKTLFQEVVSEEHPECETWEDFYDRNKFDDALEEMIDNHNPDEGISWLTVDEYLEQSCVRDN